MAGTVKAAGLGAAGGSLGMNAVDAATCERVYRDWLDDAAFELSA